MENYFIYDTVIGDLRIESNGKEVTRIEFQNENSGKESSELDDKNKKIMKKNYATDLAYKELTEYFKGKRKEFTFPTAPKGTDASAGSGVVFPAPIRFKAKKQR